jgi:putative ABC transport system substrate-binding protein
MARVRGFTFRSLLPLIALFAAETHAQQPAKVYQIGYLNYGSLAPVAHRVEALRMGLRDLGCVEGRSITLVFRSAEAANRLPDAAADLVRLKVPGLMSMGAFVETVEPTWTCVVPDGTSGEVVTATSPAAARVSRSGDSGPSRPGSAAPSARCGS